MTSGFTQAVVGLKSRFDLSAHPFKGLRAVAISLLLAQGFVAEHCVLSAAPFLASHLSSRLNSEKPFKSSRYGYTALYPNSWRQNTAIDGLFIENFTPSQVVRGVRLPKGGASIMFVVPEQLPGPTPMPGSLAEWVNSRSGKLSAISRTTLRIQGQGRTIHVIETTTRCCVVEPFLETVSWFFIKDGRFFEADLIVRANDGPAVKLRGVMQKIILSIRTKPFGA